MPSFDPTTQRDEITRRNSKNQEFKEAAKKFFELSVRAQYSYLFDWLGRPIIQYPQDVVALQQIIWDTRPDLVIETGIAHGGSLVLSASMLSLLDVADGVDPRSSTRKVLGIDIEIRAHNRMAINQHPLSFKIQMIEGSSISDEVVQQVRSIAADHKRVMVILDSNHTAEHVEAELAVYAPLVTDGLYCIVFDTVIENLPDDLYQDRPWAVGNSPMTAVQKFIRQSSDFRIDTSIDDRIQLTVAPSGYLRREKSH